MLNFDKLYTILLKQVNVHRYFLMTDQNIMCNTLIQKRCVLFPTKPDRFLSRERKFEFLKVEIQHQLLKNLQFYKIRY